MWAEGRAGVTLFARSPQESFFVCKIPMWDHSTESRQMQDFAFNLPHESFASIYAKDPASFDVSQATRVNPQQDSLLWAPSRGAGLEKARPVETRPARGARDIMNPFGGNPGKPKSTAAVLRQPSSHPGQGHSVVPSGIFFGCGPAHKVRQLHRALLEQCVRTALKKAGGVLVHT